MVGGYFFVDIDYLFAKNGFINKEKMWNNLCLFLCYSILFYVIYYYDGLKIKRISYKTSITL